MRQSKVGIVLISVFVCFFLVACDLIVPDQASPSSETTLPESSTATPTITPTPDYSAMKVLFFVSGTLGDMFYYDGIASGVKKAQEEMGFQLKIIETGWGIEKYISAFRQALDAEEFDIVVVASQFMAYSVETEAPKHPETKFILLDGEINYRKPGLGNVYCATFNLEKAAYLAGLYAGYMTQDNTIAGINPEKKLGVIGGMENPLLQRYFLYFQKGAAAAGIQPKDVVIEYIGNLTDLDKAKRLVKSMYENKVDIIYQVTGDLGLPIFQEAHEFGIYAIGMDWDQERQYQKEYPDVMKVVLTSVRPDYETSAYRAVMQTFLSNLVYGKREILGIQDGTVGIVKDGNYALLTPDEIKAKISAAESELQHPKVLFFVHGTLDTDANLQQIAEGLRKAQNDFGIRLQIIETGEGVSDYGAVLNEVRDREEFDIVMLTGQKMVEQANHLARRYPNSKVIVLNAPEIGEEINPENVYTSSLRIDEGVFLAGYYAGLMTQEVGLPGINPEKVIGVVGGIGGLPLIENRINIYKQGAIAAGLQPDGILVDYSKGFSNIEDAKFVANWMHEHQADIIFHQAGKAGEGIFQAASQFNFYAIGMDGDQEKEFNATNPELAKVILTSVYWNIGEAAYQAVKKTIDNTLPYGNHEAFGVSSGLVGLVKEGNYASYTPDDIKAKIDQMEQDITAGKIEIIQ